MGIFKRTHGRVVVADTDWGRGGGTTRLNRETKRGERQRQRQTKHKIIKRDREKRAIAHPMHMFENGMRDQTASAVWARRQSDVK